MEVEDEDDDDDDDDFSSSCFGSLSFFLSDIGLRRGVANWIELDILTK